MTRTILFIWILLSVCCIVSAQMVTVNAIKGTSSMTYHLSHPLHKIEATSTDVLYRVTIDTLHKKIESVSASVDVMTFNSGNSNRDSHAMEVIDAISYPDASFTSSEIDQSGDTLAVHGKLTFHGVSKKADAVVVSRWCTDSVVTDGSFKVSLTDFSIERPSLLLIPVGDTLSFALKATFPLK